MSFKCSFFLLKWGVDKLLNSEHTLQEILCTIVRTGSFETQKKKEGALAIQVINYIPFEQEEEW